MKSCAGMRGLPHFKIFADAEIASKDALESDNT